MNRSLGPLAAVLFFAGCLKCFASESDIIGSIYNSLLSQQVSPHIAAKTSGKVALAVESDKITTNLFDKVFNALVQHQGELGITNDFLRIARIAHTAVIEHDSALGMPESNAPGRTQQAALDFTNNVKSKETQPSLDKTSASVSNKQGSVGPNPRQIGTDLTNLLSTNVSLNLFFHAGSYLLNPYRVDYTTNGTAFLRDDGVSAKFFIEFVFNERWVMDHERFEKLEIHEAEWFPINCGPIDFQGRLAYVASNDSDTSASTIVGSGNFSTEFSVGGHIWRMRSSANKTHSVNLEVSYGAVSDRSVFDVHHRGFVGLGYLGGYSYGNPSSNRQGHFAIRFGMASVETVRFVDGDTSELTLVHGRPDFRSGWGPAIETEALIPIMQSAYLTLGARAYGHADANQFAMWIGFTHSLAGWDTHRATPN